MAWPLMRSDGRVALEGIREFQNWCVEKGFQDRVVPDDTLYDPDFVEFANDALAESLSEERSASD